MKLSNSHSILERLKYDFNTAGVLEVQIKGSWYRVTSREFRSFDGPRRLTQPERIQGLGDIFSVKMKTEEYNGPVYRYGTNQIVTSQNSGIIVNNDYYDRVKQVSKNRGK